jgi:hypothetical protein
MRTWRLIRTKTRKMVGARCVHMHAHLTVDLAARISRRGRGQIPHRVRVTVLGCLFRGARSGRVADSGARRGSRTPPRGISRRRRVLRWWCRVALGLGWRGPPSFEGRRWHLITDLPCGLSKSSSPSTSSCSHHSFLIRGRGRTCKCSQVGTTCTHPT